MSKHPQSKPKRSDKPRVSGDTGGNKSGRQIQHGQPDDAGRGSSIQGPRQDARGGPAGANQGGAPRGAARLEPSHQRDRQKKDREERPPRD